MRVVQVYLTPEDYEGLQMACGITGESMSGFAARTILIETFRMIENK